MDNKAIFEITDLIKNHFGKTVKEIGETLKANTMLEDNKLNLEAYEAGKIACEKVEGEPELGTNPYEKKTDQWFSWNRGWNSVII